jgi:hypothetical protein
MDYAIITFEDCLALIADGAKLSTLSQLLRDAWNEDTYFELDKYIDIHGYN